MSAERACYLDSTAIVKLVVREPETDALRRYLRRRGPLVSSALARTEVLRSLLPLGADARQRGHDVLQCLELLRISDDILNSAGLLEPFVLRPVELRLGAAIHLATAARLHSDLGCVVTYDESIAAAARSFEWIVATPE